MEKINFEDAMKKLEEIANELEKGDLNLEQSVLKFEEGMLLSKKCSQILEESEKRIMVLVKENDQLKEENFVVGEQ